jgi:hypothetical protein
MFVAHWLQVSDKTSITLYNNAIMMFNALFLVCFFCGHLAYITYYIRPDQLFNYYYTDLRSNYLNSQRVLQALPVLIFFPIFISAVTSFKIMLPDINPFSWDQTLAEWDRILHGGIMPWQWLHPVFGRPLITTIINFSYHLWFYLMYAILCWQAFSLRAPLLRMRFLLTFITIWIHFGTDGAISLSSAGPCYFGSVTGLIDPFKPLMAYLYAAHEQSPVWALRIQELLWESYESRGTSSAKGISAMPSMHMATSMLFALLAWQYSRLFGLLLSIFAALILIGSVHLGWHYALDSYAAIIGTWLIWVGFGWAINRCPSLFEQKSGK